MLRPPSAARPFALALSALCLGASCASGSASRDSSDDAPLVVEEETDAPSESHLSARKNRPTEDPVTGVPEALRCDTDPGSVVARRLTRLEYDNTVRDLLGIEWEPARAFPKDDFGDSFDNNAQAASVSPLLTEAYLQAAQAMAAEVRVSRSPAQRAVIVCSTTQIGVDECARLTVTHFLKRAFRRPLLDSELAAYMELVQRVRDDGGSFMDSIQAVVEAALLSVNFLYRLEFDPDSDQHHAVTDYELASRLSYLLWSSMPDDALFELAEAGELQDEEVLRREVTRMLRDSKASALLDAFVGHWLETNDITATNQPSAEAFPDFTPRIQRAMERETRLFMKDVLTGALPYDQVLTAGYSYANAELAAYYGLPGEFDTSFAKVDLQGTERVGLLTHGSVLTLTAAPNRTSPVRRGVYVLSNLLCSAPPPPPGNVQGNLDVPAALDGGVPEPTTLADRARQHASDPECYACHAIMDPIGFGLENFDAVGKYRTEEEGQPIDPSGELLANGRSTEFVGARELSELLSEDERLGSCAVRKLFIFAMGRTPSDGTGDDACRIERLTEAFQANDYDFRELITLVTLTDSFRGRRRLSSSETNEEGDTQ